MDWLFGSVGHVNTWQECFRAALIFAYGLVTLRLVGRRLFGRWSALDIVISIVFGSSLSRAMTGSADLFGTLGAVTLLVLLHWLLARAAARWPRVSVLVEGTAIELARGGRLNPKVAMRASVSDADLQEALRRVSVETIKDTSHVVLEPSGRINVVKGGRVSARRE
jgi:uncharacterized membrane protein YcaP (DUF421 family)